MATDGGNHPHLPSEIIIEILKRLRVKSVLRFRAVCKDWRNLLKSPSFIEEHYQHSAHKNPLLACRVSYLNPIYSPLCFLRYEKETVKAERIPLMDSLRRVNGLIGSSNGLLCVTLEDDTPPSLLLLNPVTREIRQVPRSTNNDDDCRYCYSGFGYSPVVRDYKIVRCHGRIINLNMKWIDRVDVYSLRTGSWKQVESGVIHDTWDLYNPVAVNGAIFWIGWGTEYRRRVLISFDLAMEVFTLIPIPCSNPVPPISLYVLGAYENKLVMIYEYLDELVGPQYAFIDLWELEEASGAYGKSWGWSKKYSTGPNRPSLHPICTWRNEIVCTDFNEDPYFLFHLTANNELNKFHTCLSKKHVFPFECFFYAESLVTMHV